MWTDFPGSRRFKIRLTDELRQKIRHGEYPLRLLDLDDEETKRGNLGAELNEFSDEGFPDDLLEPFCQAATTTVRVRAQKSDHHGTIPVTLVFGKGEFYWT